MSAQESHPETPEQALQTLLAGNQRYQDGAGTAENPPEAHADLKEGQSPFAGIIRCADSRVAPEIVFDQPLGRLFVCGVAGNLATTEVIASLEYAVGVLGTPLLVVMGHTRCGAVAAALDVKASGTVLPGSLPELVEQVALPEAGGDAVEHNARAAAHALVARSGLLAERVAQGRLAVHAGVFELETGAFRLLGA